MSCVHLFLLVQFHTMRSSRLPGFELSCFCLRLNSAGTFFISNIYESVSFNIMFLLCGVSLLLLMMRVWVWGRIPDGIVTGQWNPSTTSLHNHNNLVEEIPCQREFTDSLLGLLWGLSRGVPLLLWLKAASYLITLIITLYCIIVSDVNCNVFCCWCV